MSFATGSYDSLIAELLSIFEKYFEDEAMINGGKLDLNAEADDFIAELEEKLRANGAMKGLKCLELGQVTLTFVDKKGKQAVNFFLESYVRADTGKGVIWTITIGQPLVKSGD